ncbi:hypothetical protein PVAG01_08609 [Phlyctema vagabunda]|uniref:Zn(2)-C6 fungal-type domain-containing protein n=1 Tax=Phlyctema vagabunda TaxID=108571 RepID=A0ABR4P9Z5_9HELO
MEIQHAESRPGKKPLRSKKEDVEHKEDITVGKSGPRKRVSQACDRCRSRKDKCDGKKPACSTCVTHGRTCSYDANVKKRGLPEGYVRGLEKLWGLAIREVEGMEDKILLVLTGEDGTETLLTIWNEDGPSDSLVDTWRKSRISQELERLLPILEPSTDTGKRKRLDSESQAGKRVDISGSQKASSVTADPEASQSLPGASWPEKFSDNTSPGTIHSRHDSKDDVGVLHAQHKPSPTSGSTSAPTAAAAEVPNLPSDTWQLLDVYFSYTHCWLPIIEKHDLLRTSYQYSQVKDAEPTSSLMSGDHAALWAAISYAKYQHSTLQGPHAAKADADWSPRETYSHARSLIPDEEGAFQLGHIQALLILTLANIGLGHLRRAWLLIGQAVRVAIDMDLDRPSNEGIDASRSSLRTKHVYLGCFVLETILAARLGRRPHLRSEDVTKVGLLNEDGLEEWDPWTDCLSARKEAPGSSRGPLSALSTFNRLVQVLQILNDAICSISSDSSKQQLLITSTSLLDRLRDWKQSQPPQFSFNPTTLQRSGQTWQILPHHYHLHLVYASALSTSQILGYRGSSDGWNFEQCAATSQQIADLLKHQVESYEILLVPPTFEYFIKTAYDTVHEVQSSIESTHITLDDWKYDMDRCISAMKNSWPALTIFKTTPSFIPVSRSRRESQVAFDLISGINREPEPSQPVQTPQGSRSSESANPFSPQVFRSQSMSGGDRPQQIQSPPMIRTEQPQQTQGMPAKAMAPPSSHRSASFVSSPGNLRPNLQQASQPIFNIPSPVANETWSINQRQQMHLMNQPSMDLSQPLPSQFQHAMSINSDVESDSMFNEFAALDAMEWTDNWDQSLVNLGFTDPDNMSQDFYAMSRDPEPLYPNTVLQQLLANSNAEASGVLDGSVFGDMSMQPFGSMGFGDGNEGIEAGQILQALSQAEEQARLRRGNG